LITSFEVGAVFKIINEASPALRQILAQIRAINKAVEAAKVNISGMMKELNAGLDPAIAETRALAVEWKAVSTAAQGARRSITTASRAAANPGAVPRVSNGRPRIGGGGGGGGIGGVHYNAAGIPLPGGHLNFRGGGTALAGAGAVGYGAYLAMQNDDAIWQMIFHSGLPNTPGNQQKFRDIIQQAHSETGGSLEDIRAAAIDEIRMFRGTAGGGLDVMPEMLRAAATEARAKGHGTTIDAAMESLIGLAHMTKQYTPEEIKKLAPVFGFLSSSTAATLPQIERAAGYAVPILRSGMEIDPMQVMLMGIALQRAGITNTKSGTWIRNMALNSLPGTSLMSKMAFKRHEESLHALGLIDDKNQPTWFTDNKPDLIKMMKIAAAHAANIPLVKRAAYEKALFGAQGFGGFAVLSDPAVMQQMAALQGDLPGFKTRYNTFFQDYNGQSTLQGARKSFADFQDVLMNIGDKVLPPVNGALKDFDALLLSLQGILPKGGTGKSSDVWGKVGASALEGFGVGAAIGSVVPGIGTLAGGVTTGIVSGALRAGEIWLGLDSSVTSATKSAGSATSAIDALSRALGSIPNVGGATLFPRNYVPPAPSSDTRAKHADVILDGRKVGKLLTRRMADRAASPLEGSAYFDGTWHSPASDQVLSMG
jgi:hypothetical protein